MTKVTQMLYCQLKVDSTHNGFWDNDKDRQCEHGRRQAVDIPKSVSTYIARTPDILPWLTPYQMGRRSPCSVVKAINILCKFAQKRNQNV